MAVPFATQLIAYEVALNDLRLFPDEGTWFNQLTIEGIKTYLSSHLKESLTREVPVAIAAFKTESGIGFFSLMRILFPPITFLGSLYKGGDDSKNAVAFMKEYLGIRRGNSRYVLLGALLYAMYRHGLTHTHSGKFFRRSSDNLIVGWGITYLPGDHLTVLTGPASKNLLICPESLYKHLLEAIDIYISDFDDPLKQKDLRSTFEKGFIEMAKIYEASSVASALRSDVTSALNSL